MRKAAGLILAAMALTVGLWGANPQPKPRCMMMTGTIEHHAPDPCPAKDCCRLRLPSSPPDVLTADTSEVKYFAFSFPPVALPASTLLLPAPAASKPILSCTGSPGRQSDPLIVPLRI